jgi:hypothetical protein
MSGDAPGDGDRRGQSGRRLGAERRWSFSQSPTGYERRADRDRRGGARRTVETQGRATVVTAVWAVVGGLVVLYLFLLLLGAVTVNGAPALGVVVLVLGVVWLAHAWQRFFYPANSPQADRERRGF